MSDEPGIVDVIQAIAAGTDVDWDRLGAHSSDPPSRELLKALRLVSRVAAVHGTSTGIGPPGDIADGPPMPRTWDGLTILERLGTGSYGDVYRAWDSRLDREVALKLSRTAPDAALRPELDEGRLLARVRHPNVVTVYAATCVGDRLGLCMELVEGTTLAAALREHGPLEVRETALVGIEICRGLAAVHRAGIIHRDVKAQNVMRESGGRIVLMDFGASHQQSMVSAIGGTPLYLPPEVLGGEPATAQSDIYSVGVLLYHLVTGGFPVDGSEITALREAHAHGRISRLADVRPDLPAAFIAVVQRALSPAPEERFEAAEALEAALISAIHDMRPGRPRLAIPRRVAAAAAILITAGIAGWAWGHRSGPAAPVHDPEPILVAAFENLTGEEGLDRTVEQAFEREMGQSQVFRTVQRDRIDDALRLMRKPAHTRLDAATAREVSLRDGRIRAVLTGRIAKIGGRYELTSEIRDPVEGATLASFGEGVGRPEDLLAAIHRQAGNMRLANHTSGTATGRPLPRVTTASLQALRLYSQALDLFGADFNNSDALERYLRDALRADPDFPSALNLLAWMIHNEGRSPDEYLPYAERAVQVGQPVTEVERHFIAGSLHHLRAIAASDEAVRRAEFREAILAYEAVLRIQPDHPFAANNLRVPYEVWKRPDDLAAVYGRLADARPADLTSNITAGNEYMHVGNRAQGLRYFERARALMSPADVEAHPEWDLLLRMLPVEDAWLDGDARQARERLDSLARTIDRGDVRLRSQLAVRVINMYLTLGSLDAAEDVADRIPHPFVRDQVRAYILWQRNDTAAMRRLLLPRAADRETAPSFSTPFVLAGMMPEARRSIRGLLPKGARPQMVDYLEARVALDASNFARAGTLARRALEAAPLPHGVRALLCADTMASAEIAGGHAVLAIEPLERVTARPAATVHDGAGVFWTAARAGLAMLYRAVGRENEAQAVERQLLRLLSSADPDYPLLVELQQRQRQ